MGEISELILNGSIDYKTGKWLGSPCGYPRTVKDKIPSCLRFNEYGYDFDGWNRMKPCTRMIVKYLYHNGFRSMTSRQKVMDDFLRSIGLEKLPKNSRAYHIINDRYNDFKKYVNSIKHK